MKTNIPIELSEAERLALGLRISGKSKPATRKQIIDFVTKLVAAELGAKPAGSTELRNYVCPKCRRPIAIEIPRPKPSSSSAAATPAVNADEIRKSLGRLGSAIAPVLAALGELATVLPADDPVTPRRRKVTK